MNSYDTYTRTHTGIKVYVTKTDTPKNFKNGQKLMKSNTHTRSPANKNFA